ncbi:MAG: hypothetical protein RMY64_37095, partial [Nostoc sp. DedQUE08]|uniref:hypothetical protein n=1 Tax=Nostoc sp. DedQUE08 TaxID=3075393 RepID=UPI002AD54E7B
PTFVMTRSQKWIKSSLEDFGYETWNLFRGGIDTLHQHLCVHRSSVSKRGWGRGQKRACRTHVALTDKYSLTKRIALSSPQ